MPDGGGRTPHQAISTYLQQTLPSLCVSFSPASLSAEAVCLLSSCISLPLALQLLSLWHPSLDYSKFSPKPQVLNFRMPSVVPNVHSWALWQHLPHPAFPLQVHPLSCCLHDSPAALEGRCPSWPLAGWHTPFSYLGVFSPRLSCPTYSGCQQVRAHSQFCGLGVSGLETYCMFSCVEPFLSPWSLEPCIAPSCPGVESTDSRARVGTLTAECQLWPMVQLPLLLAS